MVADQRIVTIEAVVHERVQRDHLHQGFRTLEGGEQRRRDSQATRGQRTGLVGERYATGLRAVAADLFPRLAYGVAAGDLTAEPLLEPDPTIVEPLEDIGRSLVDQPEIGADAIDEIGLDRIDGMRALLTRARTLRRAIGEGRPGPIRAAAQDYLRAASRLQTVEAQQAYHALLKQYQVDNGHAPDSNIKDVLIPAYGYAQELARVQ